MFRTRLCLLSCVTVVLTGCARTAFQAGELPARYAATPAHDYSRIDLTRFAATSLQSDRIRPGDRLEVSLNSGTLGKESELAWQVSVGDDGSASLPGIGAVALAGLSEAEAQQTIVNASLQREVFLTPTVNVAVKKREERQVIVQGAVVSPGVVKVRQDSLSLADVLVMAGGLTNDSTGRITISGGSEAPRDSGTEIQSVSQSTSVGYTVDLQNTSESELTDIKVPAGAFVSVEKSAPRTIQVIGVIGNRLIEIPPGRTYRLLDALTLAGGPKYSGWISDKVHIIRREPGGNNTIRIAASIRRAKNDDRENPLLAAYDIVSVEENALTFTLSTLGGLFGVGTSAARLAVGAP